MMMESDGGVFRPTGFGFSGTEASRARVRDIATLLAGIHAETIGPSGGGADIGPSVQQAGIPALSLEVDGNYFLIHHTPADTVDRGSSAAPGIDALVGGDRGHDLRDRGNAGEDAVRRWRCGMCEISEFPYSKVSTFPNGAV